MKTIRFILALIVVAFVWAWYRMRSAVSTGYHGAGSVADASARRDTFFRGQLAGLTERYEELSVWRDQFSGEDTGPADDCAEPGASCPWEWAASLPAITRSSCIYPYVMLRCDADDNTLRTAKWVSTI